MKFSKYLSILLFLPLTACGKDKKKESSPAPTSPSSENSSKTDKKSEELPTGREPTGDDGATKNFPIGFWEYRYDRARSLQVGPIETYVFDISQDLRVSRRVYHHDTLAEYGEPVEVYSTKLTLDAQSEPKHWTETVESVDRVLSGSSIQVGAKIQCLYEIKKIEHLGDQIVLACSVNERPTNFHNGSMRPIGLILKN